MLSWRCGHSQLIRKFFSAIPISIQHTASVSRLHSSAECTTAHLHGGWIVGPQLEPAGLEHGVHQHHVLLKESAPQVLQQGVDARGRQHAARVQPGGQAGQVATGQAVLGGIRLLQQRLQSFQSQSSSLDRSTMTSRLQRMQWIAGRSGRDHRCHDCPLSRKRKGCCNVHYGFP